MTRDLARVFSLKTENIIIYFHLQKSANGHSRLLRPLSLRNFELQSQLPRLVSEFESLFCFQPHSKILGQKLRPDGRLQNKIERS